MPQSQEKARDHAGHSNDRADGEIDPGGQDHESHADGHNRVDRDVLGDYDERRQIEEIRSRQTKEGKDHDQRNEGAEAYQQ